MLYLADAGYTTANNSQVSSSQWHLFVSCTRGPWGAALFTGGGGLLNFNHRHLTEAVKEVLLGGEPPAAPPTGTKPYSGTSRGAGVNPAMERLRRGSEGTPPSRGGEARSELGMAASPKSTRSNRKASPAKKAAGAPHANGSSAGKDEWHAVHVRLATLFRLPEAGRSGAGRLDPSRCMAEAPFLPRGVLF